MGILSIRPGCRVTLQGTTTLVSIPVVVSSSNLICTSSERVLIHLDLERLDFENSKLFVKPYKPQKMTKKVSNNADDSLKIRDELLKQHYQILMDILKAGGTGLKQLKTENF